MSVSISIQRTESSEVQQKTTSIPLDWNELLKVYDEANFFAKPAEEIQEDTKETAEETPSRRGRKSRTQSEPVEESSDEPVQDGTTNTDSETVVFIPFT